MSTITNPDFVNGLFQLCGSAFILNHCRCCYIDKKVAGVSVLSVAFFLAWGAFNYFIFYEFVNQPWSRAGSLGMVIADLIYVGFLVYYSILYWKDIDWRL